MELIQKKDNQIIFRAKVSETLANSLRRTLNQISTIAICDVEIAKNGSPLYDETIAHRLGLISLKTDSSMKEKTEKKLKLKVKREGVIYSKDLKGDLEIVHPTTPITVLNKDQEIEISCVAKLGTGKDHSKFSPGLMFYRNNCEISLDKMFLEQIKKTFPENNIREKGEKIIIEDNKAKPLVDFCEGLAIKNKKQIEFKESDELVMTVESFGQLEVRDIFKKSLDILKKELNELSKKLK